MSPLFYICQRTLFVNTFLMLSLCSSAATFAMNITVADENLRVCITQMAQQKQLIALTDITEIECHNKNIKSLVGIEIFVNLQKLSLYNNQLTGAVLVNLPQLRHVNLAKNKMVNIQLSNLPALEDLYVFGNKLTRLEVLSLPKLKQLKANENLITVFHYQNLPALEKIYLFNNKMVDMDIYHLSLTRYIDVRQNPMPEKLYQDMDKLKGITFLHDGNAKEWQ